MDQTEHEVIAAMRACAHEQTGSALMMRVLPELLAVALDIVIRRAGGA